MTKKASDKKIVFKVLINKETQRQIKTIQRIRKKRGDKYQFAQIFPQIIDAQYKMYLRSYYHY